MITVRELGWAPGNYQWECTKCHAIGNITPRMITVPCTEWHISACQGAYEGPQNPA